MENITAEAIEKLKTTVNEINRSSDKMSEHLNYLKNDLSEVKSELKSISRILETQITHTEKFRVVENQLESLNSCSLEQHANQVKLESVQKELDIVRTSLRQTNFILLASILAGIIKLIFDTVKQ
jgi:uncharacterized coiled-coil protein SlyX